MTSIILGKKFWGYVIFICLLPILKSTKPMEFYYELDTANLSFQVILVHTYIAIAIGSKAGKAV